MKEMTMFVLFRNLKFIDSGNISNQHFKSIKNYSFYINLQTARNVSYTEYD